jgi:hypothetical protein
LITDPYVIDTGARSIALRIGDARVPTVTAASRKRILGY